jgi:hypothetical protein
MLVLHSPPKRKVRCDPKSARSAHTRNTARTNETPSTKRTLADHTETYQAASPSCSSSSPGTMPFEIELRRTLSRVDDLSLVNSPNHRHNRRHPKMLPGPDSKCTARRSKLPVGRISDFLRGRDSRSVTVFLDLFDPETCSVSEVSGDCCPAPLQEPSNKESKRAPPGPAPTGRPEKSKPNKIYPSNAEPSRASSTNYHTRPSHQATKTNFYPDVFVPPPPLEQIASTIYAEFKSDAELMLASTTVDRIPRSPRVCSQNLRISVLPQKPTSPNKPKMLPVAPWLNDSPSAHSVSVAMRALRVSMNEDSMDSELLEDDEDGDESTEHLLEMAHCEHLYSIDDDTEQFRSSPKLKVTTSTSSATAVISDVPTSIPILRSQTTSSSIRTIEWKSYRTYYESDDASRSPSTGRHTRSDSSNQTTESDKKPAASPMVNHGLGFYNAPQKIEVAPGHFVNLRGANETLLYVAADATTPRNMIISQNCIACDTGIHSVCDCEYILCPVCHTILSSGVQGHGVGLGFLTSDWDEWNFNLLEVETAVGCSPFAAAPAAS